MNRPHFALGLSVTAMVIGLSLDASSLASGRRCAASALSLVSFGGQGAAGTEFAFLRFELRHGGPCTLSGYPGVTLLDGRRRLNTRVRRYPTANLRSVQVRAHRPAYFGLVFRTADSTAGRSCHASITGLRVIPPDDRQTVSVTLVPRPLRSVCLDSVQVEPVRSARLPT